ncbi:MAG TPA: hypothetical protein VK927_11875 [Adhaeribacter sp.]|nr:hypothetical protein [Adhaeribacter sp.]
MASRNQKKYRQLKTNRQVARSANPPDRAAQRKTATYRRKPFRRQTRRRSMNSAVKGAQSSLKNFRQATILAVALTGFIMLLFSPGEAETAQTDSIAVTVPEQEIDAIPGENLAEAAADTVTASTEEATREALGALNNLWESFFFNLPKMLIGLGTLVLAWGIGWLLRRLLRQVLGRWALSVWHCRGRCKRP